MGPGTIDRASAAELHMAKRSGAPTPAAKCASIVTRMVNRTYTAESTRGEGLAGVIPAAAPQS